ncbi:peptidase [Rhizobium sp. Root708]|uniref:A24 family peptidase n=1 Tax=Rhizobium sp. Root708 TaxID=1736592 RepID=UPI0006FDBB22|nr:prepilin peptidase [Rhizobium sp. Root708]KRB58567.1 peptidase [Rhizobium sp. Root708]
MTEAAIFLIFPLCLAIAAVSDILTMTIPNRVSIILAAAFVPIAFMAGLPPAAIGMHLLAAAAVFAACFALFALNVMGGGDAKLLTAAALWFGYDPSLAAFVVYVGIIGGAVTLVILGIRMYSDVILATGLPVPHSILTAKKVPYGIAIAIGGFLAFPQSPLFLAALEAVKS